MVVGRSPECDDSPAHTGRLKGVTTWIGAARACSDGQRAALLQDQPHRQPGVGAQVVVQHHRDPAVAQQPPVVGVEVVRDEDPAGAAEPLERRDGGGVAAADRVDGLHRRVALERVEHQSLVGRVDAVAVAHLDDAAGPDPRSADRNPTSRSPSPRNTVRLSVISTSDGAEPSHWSIR